MAQTLDPPACLLMVAVDEVRRQTTPQSFTRGQEYRARISEMFKDGDSVKATVSGTSCYRVQMWRYESGELASWCSCPIGGSFAMGGHFCKHSVAVGLALAEGRKLDSDIDDLRDFLAGHTPSELIDLILEEADRDDSMRRRLKLLQAQRAEGVKELAAVVEAALDVLWDDEDDGDGYFSSCESLGHSFARVKREVSKKTAAELSTICERTIENIGRYTASWRMGRFDEMYIHGALESIWDVHLGACRMLAEEGRLDKTRLYSWLEEKDGYSRRLHPGLKKEYQRLLGGPGARQRRLS